MDRSPAEVFADHARRHELAYQVGSDGRAIFRPRVGPFAWQVSAGHGAVYATTVLHPRDGEPYNLCLVALDEGFRMMSRVEGIAPEDVRVGLRVTLDWADGDPPLPIFRPVEDDGGEGAGAGSSGGEEDGRGGGALTAARPRPPHVARPLRGVAAIAGAAET